MPPKPIGYPPTHPRAMLALMTIASLVACGGGGNNSAQVAAALAANAAGGTTAPLSTMPLVNCDDSIKKAFTFDQTTVLAVKQFAKGDVLTLTNPPAAGALTAMADVCFVKLLIGPGNSGPADAPSTRPGIGVQIWLPAKATWNQRLRAVGSGGFIGGDHANPNVVAAGFGRIDIASALPHAEAGFIGVENDKGHGPANSGAFAMNPDGTINVQGWADFARANHESLIRAKALSKLYYGAEPKYSYFIGSSSGGREGLKLAQTYPKDFNGIVGIVPAINWTSFAPQEIHAGIVIQRDLGGVPPTEEQFALVEKAALESCDVVGGLHLGYVLNPFQCKYDPEVDPQVLCPSSGGTNNTPACINSAQAKAFNKFWYGPTVDGTVPDPSVDNGFASPTFKLADHQKWFGTPRGTYLSLARSPLSIGSDQVALSLQDSTLADPSFINATGNGANKWKSMSYADLARAIDRGAQLQTAFSDVDTKNPDLSEFKAAGGRLIGGANLNDELITPGGVLNYYEKVITTMGGISSVQSFYKLYQAPGLGHGIGTSNRNALVPAPTQEQYVNALVAWVENGVEPTTLTATSGTTAAQPVAATTPICIYPKRVSYVSGDPLTASSFVCQ